MRKSRKCKGIFVVLIVVLSLPYFKYIMDIKAQLESYKERLYEKPLEYYDYERLYFALNSLAKDDFESEASHLRAECAFEWQKAYPLGTNPNYYYARVCVWKRDYETAYKAFQAVLSLDSQDMGALLGLGDLCAFQGKYAEAIGYYEQCKQLPGSNWEWLDKEIEKAKCKMSS